MRRILIVLTFVLATAPTSSTQNAAEREAVLKVVQIFFDTMTARDVEGARKILVPQARFFGMEMRKPNVDPLSISNEEYFAGLQQAQFTRRERIWNPKVRVHGLIATMWAPYDFWVDGKYSHCGVDAFDLVKVQGDWKITGGTFTMEAKCEPSPLGPLENSVDGARSTTARAMAPPDPPYVGQPVPGLTPQRFAPGIVSTDAIELNGVFSPDQREFYFTRVVNGVDTMHQIVFADGKWSSPRELLLLPNHARAESADMVISHDGQELYFLAKFPHAPAPKKPSYDIWRSRRTKDGWSQAELVPAPISTAANELYPSLGPDGSLYINSDRSGTGAIYRAARLADGTFAPPVNAGHPFAPRDGDLSIAPDGSFIVVSAQRPRVGGTYRSDLFVSFRHADGTWQEFVKLDDTINTPAHEWCPMVTPDGKYLFFSRRFGEYDKEDWEGTTDGEVYWVDVRALDRYRPANR